MHYLHYGKETLKGTCGTFQPFYWVFLFLKGNIYFMIWFQSSFNRSLWKITEFRVKSGCWLCRRCVLLLFVGFMFLVVVRFLCEGHRRKIQPRNYATISCCLCNYYFFFHQNFSGIIFAFYTNSNTVWLYFCICISLPCFKVYLIKSLNTNLSFERRFISVYAVYAYFVYSSVSFLFIQSGF